jgi:23S rRNA pseudouridine2605 synthase
MTAGRVKVNGHIVSELGSKVDPATDIVEVDGVRCQLANTHTYVMLYKPRGYLTTMSDPEGRPCVAQLVPTKSHPGLFPVGRLDADTTGLLLFTTDGNAAQDLLHPSRHVNKHYVALVRGIISRADLAALRRGVDLEDGISAPAEAALLDAEDPACLPVIPEGLPYDHCVVGLQIHEGRKHQVKRMLAAVGHPVVRLHRDMFGPLRLEGVAVGRWRYLTDAELRAIRALAR